VQLRLTRHGWEEERPDRCANGHRLKGGFFLVGTMHCDCGTMHRTHWCAICGDTVYTPELDWTCQSRDLDER
jgi:hypothetical protein